MWAATVCLLAALASTAAGSLYAIADSNCVLSFSPASNDTSMFGVGMGLYPFPTTEVSVSFWTSSPSGTLLQIVTPAFPQFLTVQWDPSRSAFLLFLNTATTDSAAATQLFPAWDVFDDGDWHFVVVTWSSDTGTVRLWIDAMLHFFDTGVNIGQALVPPAAAKGRGVCVVVGAAIQNCSSPSVGVDAVFSGQLAHLQLWNTSLTPTDVITLGASPSALSYLPSGLPNATLILSLSATEPDYEARVWIDASSYSNSVTFGHTLPGLSCPPQAVTFSPDCVTVFTAPNSSVAVRPAFPFPTLSWSVLAWVLADTQAPDDAVTYTLLSYSGGDGGDTLGLAIQLVRNLVIVTLNDVTVVTMNASTALTGNWQHIALTWSPDAGLQLYVNGSVVSSVATADVMAASLPFASGCIMLGGLQDGACVSVVSNSTLSGLLGYVSVWAERLPSDVISSFMNTPTQTLIPTLSTAYPSQGANSVEGQLVAAWQDTVWTGARAVVSAWRDDTGRYDLTMTSSASPITWSCPPPPEPNCTSTQWLDSVLYRCINCTVCPSSRTQQEACTPTSDTVCSEPGLYLGQYLIDTISQIMAGTTALAVDDLDVADIYFRNDQLKNVRFGFPTVASINLQTAMAFVSTGANDGEGALVALVSNALSSLLTQLPTNSPEFLATNPLYAAVSWPAVAANVSAFLSTKQVTFYLDSDSKLVTAMGYWVGVGLHAANPLAPSANVTAAASTLVQYLFPIIHQKRVQLLHDIRIVVHHADLALVPSTSISSLATSYGIQAYKWDSSLQDDGSTGYALSSTLPEVSMSALIAIHRQQMTRHIKAVAHTHRRADVMAGYIARWQAGESVGAIAASEHYSPYLLARQFVEALCGVDRKAVGKHMKATGLIEDARLRAEVEACIDVDEYSSPHIDRIQHAVGQEYEFTLQQTLLARGIAFETEADLRARGYSKTPDVLLRVPVGVIDAAGRMRVLHWIDSKATFGDKVAHESEVSWQCAGYVNRFGPGAVIYWFGFVDVIAADSVDVLVLTDVPCEFVTMDGRHTKHDPPSLPA